MITTTKSKKTTKHRTGKVAKALASDVREVNSSLIVLRERNLAARQLLASWMADESGYDEENWPKIKKAIEENRSSYRKRFSD